MLLPVLKTLSWIHVFQCHLGYQLLALQVRTLLECTLRGYLVGFQLHHHCNKFQGQENIFLRHGFGKLYLLGTALCYLPAFSLSELSAFSLVDQFRYFANSVDRMTRFRLARHILIRMDTFSREATPSILIIVTAR